jgi:hypothetical protein
MIAISTLLLLAETVTPCTTAGTPRLGGGAVLVRPVGSFEALPFERLGPTSDVREKPEGIQQAGAAALDDEAEGEPAEEQCEAVISIA